MYMIRHVTPADAAEIAGIYRHYILKTTVTFETEAVGEEEMRQRIADFSAHGLYFVYEEGGRIVGYCYAHPWKERKAYCHTLETTVYVSPEAHHRGIGRKLMERLIEACRETPAHALIACITGENTASIAFHRTLGFEEKSHFTEVGNKFGRWLDVIDMELLLTK